MKVQVVGVAYSPEPRLTAHLPTVHLKIFYFFFGSLFHAIFESLRKERYRKLACRIYC